MTETYEWVLKRVVEPRNTADDISLTHNQITYTIGRSNENDIVCTGDLVSRKHCLLFLKENNLFIQVLESVNGVFINGQKQKGRGLLPLKDGDIIGIGSHETSSTDLQKFVYQVHRQVVVDLEKKPLNKSLKLTESSESDQKVQNLNLAGSNFLIDAKIPETVCSKTKFSSSSEEAVFTSPISREEQQTVQNSKQVDLSKEVEMLNESMQPQMHEQRPGSTNAENEKMMSNFPVNDAGSDMLCTTTTNKSQSKPSEVDLNSNSNLDPKTCNSNKRQVTSHGTNCNMNLNDQGEINPAWENAFNAISALHNTPNRQPNPFQFAYPTHPCSYSNPQNLHSNHYQMVYPNYGYYPYPNYQMENYLYPHQNYQIPCTNWTSSYPNNQVPYVVGQTSGQTLCSVPNFETPQLNNNQSQSLCTDDLSLPNSGSIEKTKEEKDNFKEFTASFHYEAIQNTHQADGMKIENTEATSKVVSSETVNIDDKLNQQSQENNNLTHSVPVKKFELDKKKFGELANCIPSDKLYRSSSKSDEVVMNIVSWRPAEFESSLAKEVPCVIKPEKLPKTQLIYSNHEDYYKVQIPLILVSISYQIKNAYKDNIKRTTFTNCEVVENTASIIWIENADSYMVGFDLKLHEYARNFEKLPEVGDFLRIKITKGDTTELTLIFGYVANIFNNQVEIESNSESVEVTFGVVIKLIDFCISKSKIKEVSVIMSLLPSINLVKALETVKESPVLPLILNPNPEDYELSPINPDIKVSLETSSTPHLLKEKNFNDEQLDAIRKITDVALRQEPKVVLIEGSPGSGKTDVITNTIIEIFNGVNRNEQKSRKMKILVCAVFDSEIDEILCRLHNKKKYWKNQNLLKMVRIGHPNEMSNTEAKVYSVHEIAKRNVENTFKEFDAKIATMSFEEGLKHLLSQQMEMKENIETKNNRFTVLRHAALTAYLSVKRSGRNVNDIPANEYADLLKVAEDPILSKANVIICRLDTCYNSLEMNLTFRDENLIPVLIIEEATQSIEIDILKPLTFGVQTLILVADVCKRSTKYSSYPVLEENGFNGSLFKRLKSKLEQSPDSPIISFHTQYKMNKQIAYFPNKFFFQGKIRNESASDDSFPLVSYRVFNWDTSDHLKKSEKIFVTALVQCITCHTEFKKDFKPLKIGVITTSNNLNYIKNAIGDQMKSISDARRNWVSIDVYTLENFQNKEFDVILASFFKQKSNLILHHTQKMYSVITSAKHCLLLYGTFKKFDDETTSLWNCLIDDATRRKMLVNIENQPRISKLKLHILKCY